MSEEIERLQGIWSFASLEVEGSALPTGVLQGSRMVIQGESFSMFSMEATYTGSFSVDFTKTPKTVDMRFTRGPHAGETSYGIYELDGDTWTICLGLVGRDRPREFATLPNSGHALETLHRSPSSFQAPDAATTEAPVVSVAGPAAGSLDPALQMLQGEWSAVCLTLNGRAMPEPVVQGMRRVARDDETTVTMAGRLVLKARVRLDPSRDPKEIDYLLTAGPNQGKVQFGIYALSGDQAHFCFSEPGSERPNDFTAELGSGRTLSAWRRAAP